MYLFRAINEDFDKGNLQQDIGIKSMTPFLGKGISYLETVTDHIIKGSKGVLQKDYWISTTKSFRFCATEYAIPQGGKYNTAFKKKEVVVIDTAYWGNNPKSQTDSYTVFTADNKKIVDFSDENQYPLPQKKGTSRFVNEEKLTDVFVRKQVAEFHKILNQNPPDTGLLDCSLPTRNDDGRKLHVINQLGLFDMGPHSAKSNRQYDMVGSSFVTAITSGIVKKSQEVLVFNHIPMKAIKKILSFLEIEFLCAIKDEYFPKALDDLISGKVKIGWNRNVIQLQNGNNAKAEISLSDSQRAYFEEMCVDIAVKKCRDDMDSNLEEVYKVIFSEKKEIVKKMVTSIYPDSFSGEIQEESIWVIDTDTNASRREMMQDEYYDLLAIKDNGKIYLPSNPEFQGKSKKLCKAEYLKQK